MHDGLIHVGDTDSTILDSSRYYGARYSEPAGRANGKQPGGYAFDAASPAPQRMTPQNVHDAARALPGSLLHPRSSATFWLLALIVVLVIHNGRLRIAGAVQV